MIWEEILVDRIIPDGDVSRILADLFSISQREILIADQVPATAVKPGIRLLCERAQIPGDFPLKLTFYLRDPELRPLQGRSILGKFCERLRCSCLTSDQSPNPYSMVLVEGVSKSKGVFLDTERLDQDPPAYKISRLQDE